MLGAILTAGALQTSMVSSVRPLVAYALGLGIPFILSALFLGELAGRLKGLRRAGRPLQLAAGAVLVLMGVAMP